MKTSKIAVLISLVLFFTLQAMATEEKVKIVKIIDANLFRLNDGRLIRLADIWVPSQNSESPLYHYIARKAIQYANEMLIGQRFKIRYDSSKVRVGRPIPVILFKIYPLQKLDINKLYLQRGYGKYVPAKDTPPVKEYAAAEREARRKHLGIWAKSFKISENAIKFQGLYYRAGNRNLFGDQFREIGYHAHRETANILFDLRIAFDRNAEKGRTTNECSCSNYYEEYINHYKSGYVQLIFGKKWKRIRIDLGVLTYLTGTHYTAEIKAFFWMSPIVRLRYSFKNGAYVKVALTDIYGFIYPNYPIELAAGTHVFNKRLHLWAGAVKNRTLFNVVGGARYDFGPYYLATDFGSGLNYRNLFASLQLGFLIR